MLNKFYDAGILVKIVTGDNAETTTAIAKQIGFKGIQHSLSGAQLMKLSDQELQAKVMQTNIFTRMFPEAKLRIINALKANNQIVAMTGDGVNDGPVQNGRRHRNGKTHLYQFKKSNTIHHLHPHSNNPYRFYSISPRVDVPKHPLSRACHLLRANHGTYLFHHL